MAGFVGFSGTNLKTGIISVIDEGAAGFWMKYEDESGSDVTFVSEALPSSIDLVDRGGDDKQGIFAEAVLTNGRIGLVKNRVNGEVDLFYGRTTFPAGGGGGTGLLITNTLYVDESGYADGTDDGAGGTFIGVFDKIGSALTWLYANETLGNANRWTVHVYRPADDSNFTVKTHVAIRSMIGPCVLTGIVTWEASAIAPPTVSIEDLSVMDGFQFGSFTTGGQINATGDGGGSLGGSIINSAILGGLNMTQTTGDLEIDGGALFYVGRGTWAFKDVKLTRLQMQSAAGAFPHTWTDSQNNWTDVSFGGTHSAFSSTGATISMYKCRQTNATFRREDTLNNDLNIIMDDCKAFATFELYRAGQFNTTRTSLNTVSVFANFTGNINLQERTRIDTLNQTGITLTPANLELAGYDFQETDEQILITTPTVAHGTTINSVAYLNGVDTTSSKFGSMVLTQSAANGTDIEIKFPGIYSIEFPIAMQTDNSAHHIALSKNSTGAPDGVGTDNNLDAIYNRPGDATQVYKRLTYQEKLSQGDKIRVNLANVVSGEEPAGNGSFKIRRIA